MLKCWACERSCATTNFICSASLQPDQRMPLKTMLFRDLILSGGDTCVGLINSLIHRYLDDAASTDDISEKLRQVCPSLCRNEDAPVNKQLLKARTASRTDRDHLLQQTLDTWKQIPARIYLAHVCQLLADVTTPPASTTEASSNCAAVSWPRCC